MGCRGGTDVDRRGVAVAAGESLVHRDDWDARIPGGLQEGVADLRCVGVVVVEIPAARCVRVGLPGAELVGGGDLRHRGEGGVEGTDIGHGVALDEHTAVAAQLGGERLASLHGVDRQRVGGANHRDRRDDRHGRVAAHEHEVPPVLRREAVDGLGLAAAALWEAGAPLAGFEEVGLHVDDDFGRRRWCRGRGRGRRGRRRRRSVDRGRRLFGVRGRRLRDRERPAGLRSLRARPLVAAGLQCGEAGRHAGRREEEPPARPTVAASVMVGGGASPPHRLSAQLVERRWQVLAVGAGPQLQRQPRIRIVHVPNARARCRQPARRAVNAAAGSAAVTKDSPTRMAS